MRPKGNCVDCDKMQQANKLRQSQLDYRKLCFQCYIAECNEIKHAKLSSRNRDNFFLYKTQKKERKSGRTMNLLKNGISLIKGEEKVLDK